MAEERHKQTISFLKNPIVFIRDKYQEYQDKQLAREAITQDEYFTDMVRWIENTQNQLLILGYDKPFMELKETQEELANAARGKGYNRRNGRVAISAIIPEGLYCGVLEELANETTFVSILRTDRAFSKGYLVHDEWGINFWDSSQLTSHPQEKELGIIKRYAIINDMLARKMINNYQELKQQIQR